MSEILRTHLIDPASLRADQFQVFYDDRKTALLRLIEGATGKTVLPPGEAPAEDDEDAEGADD